jgi:predicted ArsR family transcriptional regulator
MLAMDPSDFEARVTELAALDQPLRRDLYALLVRRDDWLGRDEAAEALGVARSVAAFHLDKLAEAGLVDVRFERPPGRGGPGAGRPAKLYRRSHREIAISLPDRRYDLAGAVLADAVADSAHTGRPVTATLADAARRAGAAIGETVHEQVRGAEAVTGGPTAVMTALERLGYEPHDQDGEIVLSNCPFHLLAERHRDLVCGMNLQFLSGLTEALDPHERPTPRLEPAEGMCCVRLQRGMR